MISKKMCNTTDLTLLVITPDFPDQDNRYIGSIFVKYQLDALKFYFKKIIVIAPVFFSGGILPNDKYCKNYSYDNISVYYPRCLFFPRRVTISLIKNSDKLFFDTRLSAVKKIIEKEELKFDLIHAHFTWPSTYIAAKLKEKYPVPVVATIHEDSGWLQEEISMNNPRLTYAWQSADALIRVNRAEVPVLKEYNQHVYSVPNGFSPDFMPLDAITCRNQLNLPKDHQILFSIGDLNPRKGFQYLVDAMKIIGGSIDNVICYIAGNGSYKEDLEKQIRNNHLEDKIKLVGFLTPKELPLWMNSADLFVFPSLQESFGIVQIEALACGKPVIAARNVGSREIIVSDDIGLLCEPGDAQDLAEKITTGLDKDWDYEKILMYSEKFSWDVVCREILDVYATVFCGRS